MAYIGSVRLIQFWIADINSTAITDCTLASFSITFTRNGQTCSDVLSLINNGGGSYALSYTPSAPGTDQINIDDNTNDLHYCDIEQIVRAVDSTIVTVTQDYGSAGALRPGLSGSGPWVLYVFLSSLWARGMTDPSYAAGSYELSSNGNWSLPLLPGTYNLVLVSAGATTVFKFNLAVS